MSREGKSGGNSLLSAKRVSGIRLFPSCHWHHEEKTATNVDLRQELQVCRHSYAPLVGTDAMTSAVVNFRFYCKVNKLQPRKLRLRGSCLLVCDNTEQLLEAKSGCSRETASRRVTGP